jgi:hypothetical protein
MEDRMKIIEEGENGRCYIGAGCLSEVRQWKMECRGERERRSKSMKKMCGEI